MDNDNNLSDSDLIFVGEEHIDLDDSTHTSGTDGIELVIDPDQLCDDDQKQIVDEELDDDEDVRYHDNKDDKDLPGGKVEGLMVVDEWDDEEIESDDEKEDFLNKDKDAMNPEDIEKAMLSMPTMKILMDDIGHLKQNRKVIVYPTTLEDFNDPLIQDLITWSSLEEAKFVYTKSSKDSKVMIGVITFHFTITRSATKAVEMLKSWRTDLEIKTENNTNKIVEDFISDSRGKKRWTDNVAILKNLADDVKVESIRELFPQAEEIILHSDSSKHRETNPANDRDSSGTPLVPRGYAYLVFPSDDVVNAEVSETATKRLELSGHRVLLLNYRNPVNAVPRAYLRLRERKVIMRHLGKCIRMTERGDSSEKLLEQIKERIDLCTSLIEKDNKCRREMELPEPSLDELKRMSGLPALDSVACQKILMRFGIVKEKKKRSQSPAVDKRREARGNNLMLKSSSRGTFRRSPPYGGHRRSGMSDNYRRSRNVNSMNSRSAVPPLLGSSSAINPLALMMQQNLGMISGGGVLNPNLMVQPNVNLLGGAAGLLGQQSMPCIGNPMDNGKSKMLRLDETGTYHEAGDYRQQRYNSNDRGRRGGGPFSREPMRRKRSGSPPQSRSRHDYDFVGGKRSGMEENNISSPVNLLLNLSQMLSHSSDSRNHGMELGRRPPYSRDYRGSRR